MKKIFTLIALFFLNIHLYAQAPQRMSYQTVIRDTSGSLITNTLVGMQISILHGSLNGTSVYVEGQSATTNANGLATIRVGTGTLVSGSFNTIDWGSGPYFIKTEIDASGGTNYNISGTNELMSVPYAFYAANGPKGVTGPTGIQGNIGVTGPTGLQGNTGISNVPGPTGLTGATGAQGIQGVTGATGLQGVTGVPGGWFLTGNTGTDEFLNYIGTNDNVPFHIRVNGARAGRIDNIRGETFYGFESGNSFNMPQNYNNTAIGYRTLYSNYTGDYNTALGYQALYSNTTGEYNTALGSNALKGNTTGGINVAIGESSLSNNTSGGANVSIGYTSLYANTTGSWNVGLGFEPLRDNNTGDYNIALGYDPLYNNSSGSNNIGLGFESLYLNNIGNHNIALGWGSLFSNVAGSGAIAIGYCSMKYLNNTSTAYTNYNIAIGYESLKGSASNTAANNTGNYNTVIGYQSLLNNKTGSYNVALGESTLVTNTIGQNNTAIGSEALNKNTTGNSNTAIGYLAMYNNTTASENTCIGHNSGNSLITGYGNTLIGSGADNGNYANNTAVLAGIGNLGLSGNNNVRIGNSSMTSIGGQVGWTTISDERVKTNINDDVMGLAFIMKLKPVTYNYSIAKSESVQDKKSKNEWEGKYDIEKIRYSGFLSQEVEKAAQEVGYNFSGVDKPQDANGLWGLRYAEFTVPIIKAIQEQQKEIDLLKKENEEIEKLKEEIKQMRLLLENQNRNKK